MDRVRNLRYILDRMSYVRFCQRLSKRMKPIPAEEEFKTWLITKEIPDNYINEVAKILKFREEYIATVNDKYKDSVTVAIRKCLSCQSSFVSSHIGNRRCGKCSKTSEGYIEYAEHTISTGGKVL